MTRLSTGMHLDPKTCSQARQTRDPRFDGHIFIGVLTTGIYCRPICPARGAKESNVRYFASAVAAAQAGFRPCLRCRPECSPGPPASMGTSATVSRALRWIAESPLEDHDLDALTNRLGIGSGPLRRLFLENVGASPGTVMRTRRLDLAKRLIDETRLPMRQVALAAGFGTVRRFHAAIRRVYRRTPLQIRKLAPRRAAEPENEYLFRLRFRGPLDWNALLAFLAQRAIPGVEAVEHGCYRRTISHHGSNGTIEASLDEARSAVAVRIHFADPRRLYLFLERVRRLFDLDADPFEIAEHLSGDPILRGPLARHAGVRVPGCWDGFELAVRAVLGQQVTVKGASTLAGRLAREFGTPIAAGGGLTHLFPCPRTLANADLTRIGLPRARAASIRALAHAVAEGHLSFVGVTDVGAFRARFCALPGIGDWTAQYVAMRALGDPDAFPSADLGLLHATSIRSPKELEKRSQAWRPWRAYAALCLWQSM